MPWDRDTMALRVQEAGGCQWGWQCHGQGTQQGVGCCGSVLLQGTFLRAWADELWLCPCQSRKWI